MSKQVWPYPHIVTMTGHPNGQFVKKIRGKLHYFGTDPDAALARWHEIGADLLEGRQPKATTGPLTVGDLCELFMEDRHNAVKRGDLKKRTLDDYYSTAAIVMAQFGSGRRVDDLKPTDFTRLLNYYAGRFGPTRRGNVIIWTRCIFGWGYDQGIIDRPMRYGKNFKRPDTTPPQLVLEPAAIRAMLDAANPTMRAMILLGINCGFGNTDCALLPLDNVDLIGGWHNFPRPKTREPRRCHLWPETVYALIDALDARPTPRDEAHADLWLLTCQGRAWVRPNGRDAVIQEFKRLLDAAGVRKKGLNFYTLRRTFRTVADATRDQRACDYIMGHKTPGTGTRYVQSIEDERLVRVTDHVRFWLFGRPRRTNRD